MTSDYKKFKIEILKSSKVTFPPFLLLFKKKEENTYLGIKISLYCNFSSRVADATLYGITMLSISYESTRVRL